MAHGARVCCCCPRSRRLADEELGIELGRTAYALDSTTVDLCLSLFPWANFRTTKAGVKVRTLLDLAGNIPAYAWITDAKLSDVRILNVLLPEPGSIYVMDCGTSADSEEVAHPVRGKRPIVSKPSGPRSPRHAAHDRERSDAGGVDSYAAVDSGAVALGCFCRRIEPPFSVMR